MSNITIVVSPMRGTPAEPGKRYRFDYPAEFTTMPEYTSHAGQIVTVVRPLTEKEAAPPDPKNGITQMFRIQADDGWTGDAWEEELSDLGEGE